MATNNPKIELPSSERTALAGAVSVGPADPNEIIDVTIVVRRGSKTSGRFPLIEELGRTPIAERRHLTREGFAAAHGALAEDLARIRTFAEGNGLRVKSESIPRRSIILTGPVSAFSRAFEVELIRYRHPRGEYRGRTGRLKIPADLAEVIEGVFGLDNRKQAQPHFRRRQRNLGGRQPRLGGTSYTPTQVAQAYDFPASVQGAGQCIGILELGGGYNLSDLNAFFGNLGITAPKVSAVSVDGGANAPTGDPSSADGEVALDIEVAGAVAPGASIAVYFAPNTDQGFLDALTTAIHDTTNTPSVISISWGGPENEWTQQAMMAFDAACQDAAALGVTICAASGDDGATDGATDGQLHVDFPASSPAILACGGTILDATGNQINDEEAWNELGTGGGATGGGVSQVFALPSWQENAGVPQAPNGMLGRGVPDVAGDADPNSGYQIVVDSQADVVGGTSAVAPLWAGLIALINQHTAHAVGYLNPLLYTARVEATFHDINVGNNGGYQAGPGWDACTGLGTPDGHALIAALASPQMTNAVQAGRSGPAETRARVRSTDLAFHETNKTTVNDNVPRITVSHVLDNELQQIRSSRLERLEANENTRDPANSLIGLAFSGGGIRSATFNLGILQGLARLGLLRKFDYLSTVSGGGYIGSWLMAWMHHQNIGVKEVERKLAPAAYVPHKVTEASELRFLRNYSNYLTPRTGLLSADFWAFVASYLRNTLLNLIILLLALLSLLLLPRSIVYLPLVLDRFDDWGYGLAWLTAKTPTEAGFAQYWALVAGLALGLFGVVGMGLNLCWVNPPKGSKLCWITRPWAIQAFILVPLFLSAALFSYGLDQIFRYDVPRDYLLFWTMSIGLAAYGSFWIIACVARWLARLLVWPSCDGGPAAWVILPTAILAGALGGLLFLPYALSVNGQTTPHAVMGVWKVVTFGAPGLVAFMLVTGTLHVGLMGRQFLDAYREWWARLGGWLAIYACEWVLLFLLVAYMPAWLNAFAVQECAGHHYRFTVSGVLLWVASTAYGVLFGRSSATGLPIPDAPLKKKIPRWAARATPYIFILGLLVGLSVLSATVAAAFYGEPFRFSAASDYVNLSVASAWIGFAGAALLLSWRVDINAFSTHLLYRNRLVRCYLGASVPGRQGQPFTGFSAEDDLPLSSLQIPLTNSGSECKARPVVLLNASVNVIRGHELGLQTRKARSFVFTPAHSGYTRPLPGRVEQESLFSQTALAGVEKPGTEKGLSLGTAMAISGAAASPNMGSYSEPALAFLMTLFDVRLGWWLGNPGKGKWMRGSPDLGFLCLLRELFGAATDESNYLYLSDGGHFENLAVYELVRRRCKLIVACDASCDSGYTFADLHNAMERCRVDFGVEITRVTRDLVPQNGHVSQHFDLCRICYTPGKDSDDGVLLYLKPALKGDDPEDLLEYSKVNRSFPHDSTADQWFDEERFENYRNLGYLSALAAEKELRDKIADVLA
jgi:kumamolisin